MEEDLNEEIEIMDEEEAIIEAIKRKTSVLYT